MLPKLRQEAYELIVGKRQGKDIDGRPADKSGWQFHDWCAAQPACLCGQLHSQLCADYNVRTYSPLLCPSTHPKFSGTGSSA